MDFEITKQTVTAKPRKIIPGYTSVINPEVESFFAPGTLFLLVLEIYTCAVKAGDETAIATNRDLLEKLYLEALMGDVPEEENWSFGEHGYLP